MLEFCVVSLGCVQYGLSVLAMGAKHILELVFTLPDLCLFFWRLGGTMSVLSVFVRCAVEAELVCFYSVMKVFSVRALVE